MDLMRLKSIDGSWNDLLTQWERDCAGYDESFSDYASASMPVLDELAKERNPRNSGVFASKDDESFQAILQANVTYLPRYKGPVLRVRHIVFSPRFEFDDAIEIEDYGDVLANVFGGALLLSFKEFPADHVKFHLRSPAEKIFAKSFENALIGNDVFTNIRVSGGWIYLSKT